MTPLARHYTARRPAHRVNWRVVGNRMKYAKYAAGIVMPWEKHKIVETQFSTAIDLSSLEESQTIYITVSTSSAGIVTVKWDEVK